MTFRNDETTSTPSRRWEGLRELLIGVREDDPPRPGRYLETPQRWGLLPTLAFWNRPEVQKSAWLFMILFIFIGFRLVNLVSKHLPGWALPLVAPLACLPMFLGQGLLERYIRHRRSKGVCLPPSPGVTPPKWLFVRPWVAFLGLALLGLAIILICQWRIHVARH